MNEVNARRARLQLGWVTVFGRVAYSISVCNKPTRSTQPCTKLGTAVGVDDVITCDNLFGDR